MFLVVLCLIAMLIALITIAKTLEDIRNDVHEYVEAEYVDEDENG